MTLTKKATRTTELKLYILKLKRFEKSETKLKLAIKTLYLPKLESNIKS